MSRKGYYGRSEEHSANARGIRTNLDEYAIIYKPGRIYNMNITKLKHIDDYNVYYPFINSLSVLGIKYNKETGSISGSIESFLELRKDFVSLYESSKNAEERYKKEGKEKYLKFVTRDMEHAENVVNMIDKNILGLEVN